MRCPICEMAQENSDLRMKARSEMIASGVKCWVKDETGSDEIVVTIFRPIRSDQYKRLLELLSEIENSTQERPR